MAWSLIGTPVGVAIAAGAGTQSITLPGPPAIDDLILVATSGDISCADSINSAGYTVPENGTGANPGANFGYKVLTTTETVVLINKHATILKSCVVQVWRGGNAASILDQTMIAAASGNSANPNADVIVTQNANALVVCIAHLDDDDSTVNTWPSNYTNGTSANTGQSSTTLGSTTAICSRIIVSPGSEDPGAYTMSSSDTWDCIVISFKIYVPPIPLSIPVITETFNIAEVLPIQKLGTTLLSLSELFNLDESLPTQMIGSLSMSLSENLNFHKFLNLYDLTLSGLRIVILADD